MGERGNAPIRGSSSYVHGVAPEEQDRLGVLNRILNEGSLREAALQGGERIVDFGSGLGQLTRAMARAGGDRSRAVGIERSPEQIETAARLAREAGEEDRVEFRQGDVLDPPLRPDEWGQFDVAHARFILEHVPDPAAVVRVMMRAVRPGGRILLADDDHDILRLWPELPSVDKLWRAYIDTYPRAGNDPYIGRKLVALLHDAGAVPRRSTWIWFGGSAGMDMFPHLIRNFMGVLESGRSAVQAAKLLTVEEFDAAIVDLDLWGKRPDAALWFAMSWAEGVKPG